MVADEAHGVIRRAQKLLGELVGDRRIALVEGCRIDVHLHARGVRMRRVVVDGGTELVHPEHRLVQAHVLDLQDEAAVVRVGDVMAARLGGLAQGQAGGSGKESGREGERERTVHWAGLPRHYW